MIRSAIKYSPLFASIIIAACLFVVSLVSFLLMSHAYATDSKSSSEKLVTFHDRGQEKTILTHAESVRKALKEAEITLDASDAVEPGLDEELISTSYSINIYRARPVIVTDGVVREKIMTPYQTADKIVEHAGLKLNSEDKTAISPTEDIVAEGAGLELTIDRATPFTLMLYGKLTPAFTQATTVAEMLKEKNITMGVDDQLSLPLDTPITAAMTVSLWRNGTQTITEDKEIAFPIEKVQDAARNSGYHEVRVPGAPGKRTVTYEIEMQNGREISRKEIQSVIIQEPKKQVEVIGTKPGTGLTKAKGVNMFVDSKGVTHRETYYDLPMRIVMGNCGAGGVYTVRADGAKIDKDGYVIIAAHLARYPRCSVVETSLGPGKVYDTGSFTSKHPDGFDLATDWTKNDGV